MTRVVVGEMWRSMMYYTLSRRTLIALSVLLVALSVWRTAGGAPTVSGHAQAVNATYATPSGWATTLLADAGTLGGPTDAREAEQITGSVPSLLDAETLHATTIGWSDQASSEASVARLSMTVGGNTISADLVMARALEDATGSFTWTIIHGLSINGQPIAVDGNKNQSVAVSGGRVVINEQRGSAGSNAVNALHVMVHGVADVIVASASADAQ